MFACVCAGLNLSSFAQEQLVRAFIDSTRNVWVVSASGNQIRITNDSRYRDALMSPDGHTFVALVLTKIDAGEIYGKIEVSDSLLIFRDSVIIQRIDAGTAFIRSWTFWNGNKQVAIYAGALHFAGFYELINIESGETVARSQDPITQNSPPWVRVFR